jgi:hypothetical protein
MRNELMGPGDGSRETAGKGLQGRLLLSNGEPASGAEVEVWPVSDEGRTSLAAKSVTDKNGNYLFYNLHPGIYNIIGLWSREQKNMETVFLHRQVFASALDAGEAVMAKPGKIKVKTLLDSKPKKGIECYVPGTGFSALSDESGECRLEQIPPGTYNLICRLPGFPVKKKMGIKVGTDKTKCVESQWFQSDTSAQHIDPVKDSGDDILFSYPQGSFVFGGDTLYVEDGKFYLGEYILEPIDLDTVFMQVGDMLKKVYVYKVKARHKGDTTDEPEIIEFILEVLPEMPADPYPADKASGISISTSLAWSPLKFAGDRKVRYDVYLGGDSVLLEPVSWNQTVSYIILSSLQDNSTYYWRIAAHIGEITILGPVWSFHTMSSPPENMWPELPVPVSPQNKALGVDTMQVRLEWSGGDLDEDDDLVYDLYFSPDDSDLTKIASRLRDSSFVVFNLAPATTYFWQVIASDGMATSAGPVWRFTTSSAEESY